MAPCTERINTTKEINTNTREYSPVKVMQTAVVGTQGILSYRLNLEDFPANARAYAYFAENQDLAQNESRKFTMREPYVPDYSNAVVNIEENANGSYTLYELSYMKTPEKERITALQVFAKGVDADTVILMSARASRIENQDVIDATIVDMLADPKEARAGIQELHSLPFNPTDKRTALTYLDNEGKMHRVSKGAPEQVV